MRMFEQGTDEELIATIERMIETETGKKIFTIGVIDNEYEHDENVIECIVVFEDKSILFAAISVGYIDGKLAMRMQGNYI